MPRKKKRKQPPPPASLVELIQTDNSVKKYFESLLVNLEGDVQVWKDRAHAYQSKLLKAKGKNGSSTKKKKKQPSATSKLNAANNDGLPVQADAAAAHTDGKPNAVQQGVPIDDSMFDFDDDDDDTSLEDEAQVGIPLQGDKEKREQLLNEAYTTLEQWGVSCFESLGVEVVENEEKHNTETNLEEDAQEKPDPSSTDVHGDNPPKEAATTETAKVSPQHAPNNMSKHLSVQVVLGNLLECIRGLKYNDSIDAITVEDVPAFPSIFRALVIFDTVTNINHELVDRLVDFLRVEIAERWAYKDRSDRQQPKFRFDPDQEFSVEHSLAEVLNKSNLLERLFLGKLYVGLQFLRNEREVIADTIMNYIISNTPVSRMVDYPTLPPTLSLICLEAMLKGPTFLDMNGDGSWFEAFVSEQWKPGPWFWKVLGALIHCVASIWEKRKFSSSVQIRNIAELELASYQRLRKVYSSWLLEPCLETGHSLSVQLLGELPCEDGGHLPWRRSLLIAILLHGGRKPIDDVIHKRIEEETFCYSLEEGRQLGDLLWVAYTFERESLLRQLAASRRQVGMLNRQLITVRDFGATFMKLWKSAVVDNTTLNRLGLLQAAMDAARIVGDGTTALRIFEHVVKELESLSLNGQPDNVIESLFDAMRRTVAAPTVRVINLEGRKDRMAAFLAQGFRERLLIVKGVTTLREDSSKENGVAEGREFGLYAYDGRGGLIEATRRIAGHFAEPEDLSKIVATKWRPHDLKAFDRDAMNSEHLVRLSPSECACALSHVSCWKGVQRSLQIAAGKGNAGILRDPARLLRSVKISGYAEGPAVSRGKFPPAPVCVILEDDAILEDRFSERLAELLKELPRDFHFCSIGYSRPKSAPIAKYSQQLGVPSMLWYLTGYVISESGAQYLRSQLPVVGPVDSWIGLLMVNKNWDNKFGMRLGVGVHSAPHWEFKRAEFQQILQFKCFCSLRTLCTQEVRSTSTSGTVVAPTTGRKWRLRDTDIAYSGIPK